MDSNQITLGDLAAMPRWVAWQTERNPEGRVTKVPKSPHGGNARSNDPTTWGTLAEAQKREAALDKPHGLGGIGIELGDLGNGMAIGGLDLDSCRDPATGEIERWALDIAASFGSYAEVSPSGTGAKAFFTYDPATLPDLLKIMGTAGGKKWSRPTGADHPPAIELYLSGRYFAVTHDKLDSSPADLRNVARDTIEHLIRHAGPAFGGKPAAADPKPTPKAAALTDDWADLLPHVEIVGQSRPKVAKLLASDFTGMVDSSRSALAWAMGGELKRAGYHPDWIKQVLRTWDWTAAWCAEKGDGNRERELNRICERTGIASKSEPATGGAEFPTAPSAITLLSPTECDAAPGRKYVVKGLLAEKDVACVFGAPGAGKSILAPHIAYAVAQGVAVFGRRTRPGKTFYIAAEDPHGMRQRVRALRLARGDAPGFSLVEGVGNLLMESEANQLRALIAEHKPALIILDTVAMAFPGLQENEAADMGRVVALARSLTTHGAAVVLIHHDNKQGDATPRGHSILNGALDVALHLSRQQDDAGVIRAKLTKNRNGACDLDVAFTIGVESFGLDEDGDAITAPIAQEAMGAARAAKPLSPMLAAAMDVAERLTDAGRKTVPVAEVYAEASRMNVSTADDPADRHRSVKGAYQRLQGMRRVEIVAEKLSLISPHDRINTPDPALIRPDPTIHGTPDDSGRSDGSDQPLKVIRHPPASEPKIIINPLGTDKPLDDLLPTAAESKAQAERERKHREAMAAAGWRPVGKDDVCQPGMEFRLDMSGGQSWGRMPPSIPDELESMLH
jgi:KaiC/GvpD/RAD55 family RecA-like ATPase